MWNSQTELLEPHISRTRLLEDDALLSYKRLIGLLENDETFRSYLTKVIVESPFEAFFWETPQVSNASLEQAFEFVLFESSSLANLKPDPSPFATQFAQISDPVLSFPNLGGDAVLVVPRPVSGNSHYTHLARFLRNAPASQVSAFWKRAGQAMAARVSSAPVWLSTAGMGVSWLHLRLDSRPKYYRYTAYK